MASCLGGFSTLYHDQENRKHITNYHDRDGLPE